MILGAVRHHQLFHLQLHLAAHQGGIEELHRRGTQGRMHHLPPADAVGGDDPIRPDPLETLFGRTSIAARHNEYIGTTFAYHQNHIDVGGLVDNGTDHAPSPIQTQLGPEFFFGDIPLQGNPTLGLGIIHLGLIAIHRHKGHRLLFQVAAHRTPQQIETTDDKVIFQLIDLTLHAMLP